MKRRDILRAGIGLVSAGGLEKVLAAQPCPPTLGGTLPVNCPAPAGQSGLDFPGNQIALADGDDCRFRWQNPQNSGFDWLNTTIMWRVLVREQTDAPGNGTQSRGYMSLIFWGSDDGNGGFKNWRPESFVNGANAWGFHPYPDGPNTTLNAHRWEIADGSDTLGDSVVYDRWYTQVIRITGSPNNPKVLEYFYDFDRDPGKKIVRNWDAGKGNGLPQNPVLTCGGAPWEPDNEIFSGIVRGYQMYSTSLSDAEIIAELASPRSTSTGQNSIWYLNLDPTPADISDKSGNNNNPSWYGPLRPGVYSS